jgi:hypothetical protein
MGIKLASLGPNYTDQFTINPAMLLALGESPLRLPASSGGRYDYQCLPVGTAGAVLHVLWLLPPART